MCPEALVLSGVLAIRDMIAEAGGVKGKHLTGRAGGRAGWWIARAAGACCGMARGCGGWIVMPGRLHKGGGISS